MTSADFVQLGITDVVSLIRVRQLSPVELVQAYLDRNDRPREPSPETRWGAPTTRADGA